MPQSRSSITSSRRQPAHCFSLMQLGEGDTDYGCLGLLALPCIAAVHQMDLNVQSQTLRQPTLPPVAPFAKVRLTLSQSTHFAVSECWPALLLPHEGRVQAYAWSMPLSLNASASAAAVTGAAAAAAAAVHSQSTGCTTALHVVCPPVTLPA